MFDSLLTLLGNSLAKRSLEDVLFGMFAKVYVDKLLVYFTPNDWSYWLFSLMITIAILSWAQQGMFQSKNMGRMLFSYVVFLVLCCVFCEWVRKRNDELTLQLEVQFKTEQKLTEKRIKNYANYSEHIDEYVKEKKTVIRFFGVPTEMSYTDMLIGTTQCIVLYHLVCPVVLILRIFMEQQMKAIGGTANGVAKILSPNTWPGRKELHSLVNNEKRARRSKSPRRPRRRSTVRV